MIYIFVSSEDDLHNIKGGIGTYISILVSVLKKRHDISKIFWISESKENDFDITDDKVKRIYFKKKSFVSRANIKVLDIVNCHSKLNYIIIEAPEWEGLLHKAYKEIKNKNVLKVTRLHTPLIHTQKLNEVKGKNFIYQHQREKKQIIYSDFLSYPTNYMKSIIKKHFFINQKNSSIPYKVIPNPINIYDFYPSKKSRSEVIKEFSNITNLYINDKNYNIFIVGSLEKRKGITYISQSIPLIISKIKNANFYFIGNFKVGDTQMNLNEKISTDDIRRQFSKKINNQIHFSGCVPYKAMPTVMQAGDVYPICYLGDNFPGVVAEIILSEKPTILYMKGGIPEMVPEEECTSLLKIKEEKDINLSEEIADKVCELFEKNRLGCKNLSNKIAREFNPDFIVDKMLKSYNNIKWGK